MSAHVTDQLFSVPTYVQYTNARSARSILGGFISWTGSSFSHRSLPLDDECQVVMQSSVIVFHI